MENQKIHLEKLLKLFQQVALLLKTEITFLSLMFNFPICIQFKNNHIFIQIYIKRYKIILFFTLIIFI